MDTKPLESVLARGWCSTAQQSTAWNRAVSCGSGLVLAWVGLVETEFWLFVAWLSSDLATVTHWVD